MLLQSHLFTGTRVSCKIDEISLDLITWHPRSCAPSSHLDLYQNPLCCQPPPQWPFQSEEPAMEIETQIKFQRRSRATMCLLSQAGTETQ
jgi:hypothetical protein